MTIGGLHSIKKTNDDREPSNNEKFRRSSRGTFTKTIVQGHIHVDLVG